MCKLMKWGFSLRIRAPDPRSVEGYQGFLVWEILGIVHFLVERVHDIFIRFSVGFVNQEFGATAVVDGTMKVLKQGSDMIKFAS